MPADAPDAVETPHGAPLGPRRAPLKAQTAADEYDAHDAAAADRAAGHRLTAADRAAVAADRFALKVFLVVTSLGGPVQGLLVPRLRGVPSWGPALRPLLAARLGQVGVLAIGLRLATAWPRYAARRTEALAAGYALLWALHLESYRALLALGTSGGGSRTRATPRMRRTSRATPRRRRASGSRRRAAPRRRRCGSSGRRQRGRRTRWPRVRTRRDSSRRCPTSSSPSTSCR